MAPNEPTRLRLTVDLANTLLADGATEHAATLLRSARRMPGSDVDRYSLGEALLRATNGVDGWDLYDLHPSRPQDRLGEVRRWDGEPCTTLVLVGEQGFGDALQFLRFVPMAARSAARVVLAIHDELADLVAHSPVLAGVEVMRKSAARCFPWDRDTRWQRLMSLPALLGGRAVPEPVGRYLQAPPDGPNSLLPPGPEGVRTVGVAWRSTQRRGFPSRSFPARLVGMLTAAGQVRTVCLHRAIDVAAPPPGTVMTGIRNFSDTAAVIAQCDYVVTADTVTAHLAPALGVPTLICLLAWPDWRWGSAANPTAWYAHARLIFQDTARRWEPVLATAASELAPLPL